MSIFFTEQPVVSYADVMTADTGLYAKFFNDMLKHGIYLAPAQFEAMFISEAHGKEDIDKTVEIIGSCLKNIYR